MFNFFSKKPVKAKRSEFITNKFTVIKNYYCKDELTSKRKKELSTLIEKYGYVPYSQSRAIEELTPAEVIFALEKKLEINETYKENCFTIEENEISPVVRQGYKDADWIKREQHDIKLVNLAALGDGLTDSEPAKFIDWLRQIVILPSGNIEKGVLSTTIYLMPFHPRDFRNVYLLASTEEVSETITDNGLKEVGINAKEQIQIFVALAQLAGHPVYPKLRKLTKNLSGFFVIRIFILSADEPRRLRFYCNSRGLCQNGKALDPTNGNTLCVKCIDRQSKIVNTAQGKSSYRLFHLPLVRCEKSVSYHLPMLNARIACRLHRGINRRLAKQRLAAEDHYRFYFINFRYPSDNLADKGGIRFFLRTGVLTL